MPLTTPSPSQYFQDFLTSETSLKRRYKECSRRMAFAGSSRQEAQTWQKRARRRLAELIGLQHFEKITPRARMTDSYRIEGMTREEWRLETERDVWMPFYLFIPDGLPQRAPLVLCPHGHSSAGKWATGGRSDIAAMRPVIEQYNYDYGLQIARAGFITACPDARGFGERREPAHQNDREDPKELVAESCRNLMLAGGSLGLTVQGMWTWDLMRLVDFLSQDKRVDASRIGCAGLSGGGLQTLDLSALDTRIKAAVVSGYFYGVRESLLIQNANCMCNLVPGLWHDFDMGDIGGLIAPRGLFIETGDKDELNGASNLKNVESQVKISRRVYRAFEERGQLKHHIFDGEHRWDGSQAIPWLQEQLQ